MNTKHVLLSSVTPMIPTGSSLAEALEFYVGELEVKPWGRREFHMIVPHGVCLQFYQSQDQPVP